MSVPGVDKAAQQSLGDLAQIVSEQAAVLVRQEVGRARRELTAKASDASSGAAMIGGAALLGTLAAGTGTAALVLLLAGRPQPSAAALGVTGLYAGAGALLARQGIAHLRATAPPIPEEPVQSVKRDPGSKKKPTRASESRARPRSAANRTRKAASSARRTSDRSR